ncbi:Carboxypeptidase T precursor [compost metagenome]
MRFVRLLPLSLAALMLAGCGLPLPGLNQDSTGQLSASSAENPRVRLFYRNKAQLDRLVGLGMDIHTVQPGYVEGFLDGQTRLYAAGQGLRMVTLPGSLTESLPTGYQSYEDMTKNLKGLAETYPKLAALADVGDSWEKQQGKASRDVWALKITARPEVEQPAALFTGGHHARELAPVEISYRLAKMLLEGYGKDPRITRLLDSREVWIVPMVNPDGRSRVEGGEMFWRKNVHPFDGGVGVDLNRNYDAYWEQGDASPRKETFRGETAFSEPETQAIRNLFAKRKFGTWMDYHAYGNAVIWPPGYTRDLSADDAVFRDLGKRIAAPGYSADTIARTFYLSYGSGLDWAYTKFGTLGFCSEMGTSFHPSFREVDKLFDEHKEGALLLIEAANRRLK